jgi:hypothetical protein
MSCFRVITFTPNKSYATAENAIKALDKALEKRGFGPDIKERPFNVFIQQTPEGRYFPVICNITPAHFHWVLHIGFCLVN